MTCPYLSPDHTHHNMAWLRSTCNKQSVFTAEGFPKQVRGENELRHINLSFWLFGCQTSASGSRSTEAPESSASPRRSVRPPRPHLQQPCCCCLTCQMRTQSERLRDSLWKRLCEHVLADPSFSFSSSFWALVPPELDSQSD